MERNNGSQEIRLAVNGGLQTVRVAPDTPLLYVLRNDLALNGPKYGCGLGECGACAVLLDGQPARACVVRVDAAARHRITTLEGLGTLERPHPVQAAFIAAQAAQCGYCLNGMIIATVGLLRRDPRPSDADIRTALAGHLCRCGAHLEILAAVHAAAEAPAHVA